MIDLLNHTGIRKEPRFNSKKYAGWIAKHNCIICGNPEVQCSHTLGKGVADNKASAIFLLPLCVGCHLTNKTSIHNLGVAGFEIEHSIDLNSTVWQFLERYCEENGIRLRDKVVLALEQVIGDI